MFPKETCFQLILSPTLHYHFYFIPQYFLALYNFAISSFAVFLSAKGKFKLKAIFVVVVAQVRAFSKVRIFLFATNRRKDFARATNCASYVYPRRQRCGRNVESARGGGKSTAISRAVHPAVNYETVIIRFTTFPRFVSNRGPRAPALCDFVFLRAFSSRPRLPQGRHL